MDYEKFTEYVSSLRDETRNQSDFFQKVQSIVDENPELEQHKLIKELWFRQIALIERMPEELIQERVREIFNFQPLRSSYSVQRMIDLETKILPEIKRQSEVEFWVRKLTTDGAFRSIKSEIETFVTQIQYEKDVVDLERRFSEFVTELLNLKPQIAQQIRNLDLLESPIFKIPSFMQLFTNLEELDLSYSYIEDISPLENLPNLRSLILVASRVQEIPQGLNRDNLKIERKLFI